MTAIGPKECPNADDIGAALHFLVQAFDRFVLCNLVRCDITMSQLIAQALADAGIDIPQRISKHETPVHRRADRPRQSGPCGNEIWITRTD